MNTSRIDRRALGWLCAGTGFLLLVPCCCLIAAVPTMMFGLTLIAGPQAAWGSGTLWMLKWLALAGVISQTGWLAASFIF